MPLSRFLSELVNVDLSHNHIMSITEGAFRNQGSLKQLKIDGNKIGQVSNRTFFKLPQMEVISLRSNEITELPQNVFEHSKKLQKVDFARNRISKVHSYAFKGLKEMRILHLEDNYLQEVPSNAFQDLSNLAELYLSGNPFVTTVPTNSFVALRSLTFLDLSSCRLKKLEGTSLRGLVTLRRLRLHDNNFSRVPTEAFRSIPNLHDLSIGRNPFTTISKGKYSVY